MWTEKNNKLEKDFTFTDFTSALQFVNKVGAIAEKLQHHPDIFIHDYKIVTISTSTHSAGAITEKDHELSKLIDAL